VVEKLTNLVIKVIALHAFYCFSGSLMVLNK